MSTKASTLVASNDGTMVEQDPVLIDASLFYNFVMIHHEWFDYPSNASMQSCVELIVSRGKAEIERQIKTARKTAENKVYGDLARKYNLTLDQAQAILSQAAQRVQAEKVKP